MNRRTDFDAHIDQLRDLWCGWDPIGCLDMPDWPRDEYDSYLAPCLSLLQRGATEREITEYLEWAAYRHMGLSATTIPPATFAMQLLGWWQARNGGAERAN